MRIGIYGGSFDPIHHGHLVLARDAMEQFSLDEVRFVPASVSPFKTGNPMSPGALRAEMIASAIVGEPGFRLDDRELRRTGPSFAIDTVREMIRETPDSEWYYFIGADNVADLPLWRDWNALERLVHFVVYPRPGFEIPPGMPLPSVGRHIEISSTEIRGRVANGLSIRYLVTREVADIIRHANLYQPKESPSSNPST